MGISLCLPPHSLGRPTKAHSHTIQGPSSVSAREEAQDLGLQGMEEVLEAKDFSSNLSSPHGSSSSRTYSSHSHSSSEPGSWQQTRRRWR